MKDKIRKDNIFYLSYGFIAFLFVFVHFYKLGIIPNGMHIDEISTAYDAFCLSAFGVERHLHPYPVYFLNHGDGQSALATYLTLLIDKLAGHASILTVRIIPAVFSVIAGVFGYLYAKEKWQSRKTALAMVALYTILPIFIAMQRWMLDSQLLMPLSIVICFLTWKAYEKKSTLFYFLTGLTCSIAMYTYVLSFIIVPVFLLFMLAFAIRSRKIDVKCALALIIPYVVLSLPIIGVQIINFFDLEERIIFGFDFTKLGVYRSGDLAIWPLWLGLARGFKAAFSGDFTNYNAIPKFGTLYYISIPFVIIGLVKFILDAVRSWKTRKADPSIPILAWTLGSLVMMALMNTDAQPTTSRINYIFFMLLLLLVQGLVSVWNFLRNKERVRSICFGVISLGYLACFAAFAHYYFGEYVTTDLLDFYPVYEDVAAYYTSEAGARAGQYPLCVRESYFWKDFYNYSFKLNPAEQPAYEENGLEFIGGRLAGVYPKDITLGVNYIIPISDSSSPVILSDCGFREVEFDQCYLFESPLLQYRTNTREGMHVDKVIYRDEEVLISGWCVDAETGKTFTEMIAVLNNQDTIQGNAIDRQDVADTLGNPELASSGFELHLPKNTFATTDKIVVYGISEDGTKKELLSYAR